MVLMENKNREDLEKFIMENHANLDVLINHLIVNHSQEAKTKKFNIKWKAEEKQKIEMPKV